MTIQVLQTEAFKKWLSALKDKQAARAIVMRLTRVEAGNLGDVKSVGQGISEMRIFTGKGYRLYFTKKSGRIVILLCGGNKATQTRDIVTARKLATMEYEL